MARGLRLVHSAPVIKKYSNRRLYNTAASAYVTLGQLAQMAKDGGDFVVLDADTGEDITRKILVQIIAAKETKGEGLLPVEFLRHLATYYGDSLESLVSKYLEQSMSAFAANQDQMRQYLRRDIGGPDTDERVAEMARRGMAAFEEALSQDGEAEGDEAAPGIDDLQARLSEMEKKLDDLLKGKPRRP